ncbi:MAG: hypothetical protein A2Y62_21540 [Candidatus Fischerbacteria bacterium RBG_13_37_8]|uniref:Uncharacterized protein n=1 Tax=Candidatus Fischerbacteria bacterium RBG_13_37_8 TaxID=1817863 RepID=A0A1F5VX71_9BACT|nr:MAG: hypothetical protein A2Y62_21540 [Candidatus Fischerbacteria bacterium RBG_13_37_8]
MQFNIDASNAAQKSIEASQKVLEIQPENALAYRNIGSAYALKAVTDLHHEREKDMQSSKQNALAAFQKAIILNPRGEPLVIIVQYSLLKLDGL